MLYEYRAALKGFAAQFNRQVLRQLCKNPQIEYLEQDKRIALENEFTQPDTARVFQTTQTGATWGLDRIK